MRCRENLRIREKRGIICAVSYSKESSMRYLALAALLTLAAQFPARTEEDNTRKEKWVEKITEKEPAPAIDSRNAIIDADVSKIDRPLQQIMDYFSTVAGVNIKVQAENAGRADEIRKLIVKPDWFGEKKTWREHLDAICAKLKLRIDDSHLKQDKLVYIYRPESVTMTFKDADVREVIFTIAEAGKLSVVIDPEVQGKVSANFKDVACDDALDIIVKSLGYVTVHEKGATRVNK
jgi:hypothetical protein